MKAKTKVSNLIITTILLLLPSCKNNKTTTLALFLNNTFKQDTIPTEIRCDSYSILGNGLYVQHSKIFEGHAFEELKSIKVGLEKEDFSTKYGGGMITYSFNDEIVKFWDNYLFIENEEYRGDFYIAKQINLAISEKREFLSLHIDNGNLTSSNYDLQSGELRDLLTTFEFETYDENTTFDQAIDEISLNGVGSLKVYSSTVFSVFQRSTLYKLKEGFSFSYTAN